MTDAYFYGVKYLPRSLTDQIDLILEKVFHKAKDPEETWSSVMTLEEWRDIHQRLFTKEFISAASPIAEYAGISWTFPTWYPDLEKALAFYLLFFIASITCSILSAVWILKQEHPIWFV